MFPTKHAGHGLRSCSCLLVAPGGNFDAASVAAMPKLRIKILDTCEPWLGVVPSTDVVQVGGEPPLSSLRVTGLYLFLRVAALYTLLDLFVVQTKAQLARI